MAVFYETPEARKHLLKLADQHEDLVSNGTGEWTPIANLKDDDERIFQKALDAAWVILAGSCRGDFDSETKRWLDRWAMKRFGKEGALIGLFHDSCNWDVASVKELHLRHVARAAGLDYLSRIPSSDTTVPDSLDSFNERAGRMTSVLDHILSTRPSPLPPV